MEKMKEKPMGSGGGPIFTPNLIISFCKMNAITGAVTRVAHFNFMEDAPEFSEKEESFNSSKLFYANNCIVASLVSDATSEYDSGLDEFVYYPRYDRLLKFVKQGTKLILVGLVNIEFDSRSYENLGFTSGVSERVSDFSLSANKNKLSAIFKLGGDGNGPAVHASFDIDTMSIISDSVLPLGVNVVNAFVTEDATHRAIVTQPYDGAISDLNLIILSNLNGVLEIISTDDNNDGKLSGMGYLTGIKNGMLYTNIGVFEIIGGNAIINQIFIEEDLAQNLGDASATPEIHRSPDVNQNNTTSFMTYKTFPEIGL